MVWPSLRDLADELRDNARFDLRLVWASRDVRKAKRQLYPAILATKLLPHRRDTPPHASQPSHTALQTSQLPSSLY